MRTASGFYLFQVEKSFLQNGGGKRDLEVTKKEGTRVFKTPRHTKLHNTIPISLFDIVLLSL